VSAPGASSARDVLAARVRSLIDRLAGGARDDAARDALLRELLRWQRAQVAVYDRIVTHLGAACEDPLQWPAIPTDVFRAARVASHDASDDVRVFRTSGTTGAARGSHHLRDLSLYDRAAEAAARYALFPDTPRMKLVVLAPPASELPDSSLSYMLERFALWFGEGESVYALRDGRVDAELLARTFTQAERQGMPIALLGTSFAFVHAEDALGPSRFTLPAGSRIMQTGGFKGRAREVDPAQMSSLLAQRYGVPEPFIVQEYGMTELSSQLYETTLREAALHEKAGTRRLWWPGWVRVTIVDPETLAPVAAGAEGLARIDDLANLDTACAIQTADRARALHDGIVVFGRASAATPRGCSIAADAALGG
jgi:acyl-CoA synthetase (AMP-forming)/AMP-acid ligase II